MKYKVGKSKIHGDGIFATQPIAKGEYISDEPDYIDNVNQTIASSFHNHDVKNANVLNVEKGNKRFLIAKRGIEVGEEITADYNLTPTPPFEDPNDFKDLDERELTLSDEEVQEMIDAGYEVEELPEAQEGREIEVDKDAMNAMMKARLAYANEFGNPAAQSPAYTPPVRGSAESSGFLSLLIGLLSSAGWSGRNDTKRNVA